MHLIYLIHKFHNLSWITEINELFHDILIYWDAPVFDCAEVEVYFRYTLNILHLKTDIIKGSYRKCVLGTSDAPYKV